jgi:hypothetical protein
MSAELKSIFSQLEILYPLFEDFGNNSDFAEILSKGTKTGSGES